MKKYIFLSFLFVFFFSIKIYCDNVIVYTANQSFDSRIYILRMDGSVYNYFEYFNYHFVDMEVINNELYVSEGFAPRVYKVDLNTGNLEVIVDDWSLYYFYDLTFDGTYFYVTEWDLNRYDINGNKDGTANFNEDVMGSAFDGNYYWTLNDTNEIKCWDISNWPILTEITDSLFSPPTPECRGLWFDGTYFWTAESKDYTGYIYQFNSQGQIINQWNEPTFKGWSACVINDFISGIEEEIQEEVNDITNINYFQSSGIINIELSLYQSAFTNIDLYNISGTFNSEIISKELSSGYHQISYFCDDLKSGIYFCRISGVNHFETHKILYLK